MIWATNGTCSIRAMPVLSSNAACHGTPAFSLAMRCPLLTWLPECTNGYAKSFWHDMVDDLKRRELSKFSTSGVLARRSRRG